MSLSCKPVGIVRITGIITLRYRYVDIGRNLPPPCLGLLLLIWAMISLGLILSLWSLILSLWALILSLWSLRMMFCTCYISIAYAVTQSLPTYISPQRLLAHRMMTLFRDMNGSFITTYVSMTETACSGYIFSYFHLK